MVYANTVTDLRGLYMIKMYSTHCPRCNTLQILLDRKGIEYEVCEDIDVMEEKGFMSVPMLETDEGVFNFSDAIKWVGAQ